MKTLNTDLDSNSNSSKHHGQKLKTLNTQTAASDITNLLAGQLRYTILMQAVPECHQSARTALSQKLPSSRAANSASSITVLTQIKVRLFIAELTVLNIVLFLL